MTLEYELLRYWKKRGGVWGHSDLWPLTTKFWSVHLSVKVDVCAKFGETPSSCSWDVGFMRTGQTTWKHNASSQGCHGSFKKKMSLPLCVVRWSRHTSAFLSTQWSGCTDIQDCRVWIFSSTGFLLRLLVFSFKLDIYTGLTADMTDVPAAMQKLKYEWDDGDEIVQNTKKVQVC